MTENGLSDEKIRELGVEEANKQLSDSEFRRWQELRKESLQKEAEEKTGEIEERNAEAIDTMVRADMSELTTEIELYGNEVEVLTNLDRKERLLLRELDSMGDQEDNPEEWSEEKIEEFENKTSELFAQIFHTFNKISVDGEKETLAKKCVDKWGTLGSLNAIRKIYMKTMQEQREKAEKVEKFR